MNYEHDDLAAWRAACDEALRATDALFDAWRRFYKLELKADPVDIDRLKLLLKSRIYPVNAFGEIARLDISSAMSQLLSWYVGAGVNPDEKFGGFSFELGAMLGDLYGCGGEEAVRSLLAHPAFNQSLLADSRVIDSLCFAFDIDEPQLHKWLTGAALEAVRKPG